MAMPAPTQVLTLVSPTVEDFVPNKIADQTISYNDGQLEFRGDFAQPLKQRQQAPGIWAIPATPGENKC